MFEGVRAEVAVVQTPDGHGRLEQTKFHTPSGQGGTGTDRRTHRESTMSNFAVEDIDAVVAG